MHSLWERTICENVSTNRKRPAKYNTRTIRDKNPFYIGITDDEYVLSSLYMAHCPRYASGKETGNVLTVGKVDADTINQGAIIRSSTRGFIMQASPTKKHAMENLSAYLDWFMLNKITITNNIDFTRLPITVGQPTRQQASCSADLLDVYICKQDHKTDIVKYCYEHELFFDTVVIDKPVDTSGKNMIEVLENIRAVMKSRSDLLLENTGGGFIINQFIELLNRYLSSWVLCNGHMISREYPDTFISGLTTLDITCMLQQIHVPKYIIDTEYIFGDKDEWCKHVDTNYNEIMARIDILKKEINIKDVFDNLTENMKATKKTMIDNADVLCEINPMYENIYVYASMDGKML